MKRNMFILLFVALGLVIPLAPGCQKDKCKMGMEGGPCGPVPYEPSAVCDPKCGPSAVTLAIPTGRKSDSTLWLEKSAPAQVIVGKENSYNIKLTNLTDCELTDVSLAETLPADVNIKNASPDAKIAGQVITWNMATLGPKESRSFCISFIATGTGCIVGCSEVNYRNPKACVSIAAVKPELRVSLKTTADVILCDDICNSVLVSNTGTTRLTNVQVKIDLPAGLRAPDNQCSPLVFKIDALDCGQSKEFTYRTKADKTGSYNQQAYAWADCDVRAESGMVTTMVRQPILSLVCDGVDNQRVGCSFIFKINLSNTGDAEARDTLLMSTLPNGADFVEASDGGTVSNGQVNWKLGTLQPGDKKQVSVTVKAACPGQMCHSAKAEAYCASAQSQCKCLVEGIPGILLECVDLCDPVGAGCNTTYEITVLNQGMINNTNMVIKCQLPEEMEFVSASGPTKESVDGKTITFGALGTLAPKDKAVWKVNVKGLKAGDVRFKCWLTADQMTGGPAEKSESTHIY